MSCDRRCYDQLSSWHGHADCNTCAGKDDGASAYVKGWRAMHWKPHADNREPPPAAMQAAQQESK